jgi:putative hemolysin
LLIVGLLSIPVLIAINGYFVAIEFALVALRKTRIEELVTKGVRGAKAVEAAHGNLNRSIAAAQLGITVASIALGAVGESVLAKILEPWFDFLPENIEPFTRHSLATFLSITLITFLHVILGEQVPKIMAIQSSEKVALITSKPLLIFSKLTWPILQVMNAAGNLILKMLGFKTNSDHQAVHSLDELGMLIQDTHEAGLLESEQATYVKNVFQLSDKRVRDCMIPKEKMDALELRTPTKKVMEIVRNSGHTRLPVYDGDPNNIVGILNTKNLFYFLTLGHVAVLADALYPTEFVDPDTAISNTLSMFRKTHRHMAVVRDPIGQVLGLITLEDVLEEIIGDIEDEQDDAKAKRAKPSGSRG